MTWVRRVEVRLVLNSFSLTSKPVMAPDVEISEIMFGEALGVPV